MALPPGLYKSAPCTFAKAGILTLDARGNTDTLVIFQTASTLITAVNSRIIFAGGGAQAKNVYWQVSSSVTLGIESIFNGIHQSIFQCNYRRECFDTGRSSNTRH